MTFVMTLVRHLAPELLTDRTVPGSVPFRAPGQRLRCVRISSQSDQRLSSNGQKRAKRCKFIVVPTYPMRAWWGCTDLTPFSSPTKPCSRAIKYQSLSESSDLLRFALWWLSDDSLMTLWWLPEDSLRTPWGLPEDSLRTCLNLSKLV